MLLVSDECLHFLDLYWNYLRLYLIDLCRFVYFHCLVFVLLQLFFSLLLRFFSIPLLFSYSLFYFLLQQLLYHHHEACCFLLRHVNIAEWTFPDFVQKLKVIDCEALGKILNSCFPFVVSEEVHRFFLLEFTAVVSLLFRLNYFLLWIQLFRSWGYFLLLIFIGWNR